MQLGNAALGKLARMICGDDPYARTFPYRSSSYLTSFFEELDLDYVHDGSTRYWWVRSVLVELNEKESDSDALPSADLARVIEYVVDPDHYAGEGEADQGAAILALNESLRRYELVVDRDDATGAVHLRSASSNYVSTAKPRPEPRRVITFSPAVFAVPEQEPASDLVAVMMPFSAEFDTVYKAIGLACDDAELRCYRADDIWEESTFIQDIFNLIYQSAIVIVDFTARNSNVMYETGISHTLGKIVVPITQSIEDIPSDLKPHRALKYLPNNEGLDTLRTGLAKRLTTIRSAGRMPHN